MIMILWERRWTWYEQWWTYSIGILLVTFMAGNNISLDSVVDEKDE